MGRRLLAGLCLLVACTATAQPAPTIAIDNFARVDAHYFRGAQPQGHDDYRDLAVLGVKTIIDLTSDDGKPAEATLTEAAGMKYVHIPMTTHTIPTPAQVQQFFGVVNDSRSQPVYVHCVGGSHRTGVMTALYRMTNDHWTADRAFAEMKTFKFGPDFLHSEFKRFVLGYHVEPASATAAKASVGRSSATGSP
jgi:protein tyrosine/serine phosphatase